MNKENKYLQWLTENTITKYWHDSAVASELDIAVKNGATGVTTNPVLISQTIQQDRAYWEKSLASLDQETKGFEKVKNIMKTVNMELGSHLPQPSDDVVAGVCTQTNPSQSACVEEMVEQADQYAQWSPQITIKLPATNAGIQAAEICASKGYNVAVTVSFTVPQVLAAGAALQRGFEKARQSGIKPGTGIAVLMGGRLDDYLRDVMNDTNNEATEADIIWAGVACMKRAYKIFQEKGYEAYIMPAGCRGSYHITEVAGARMICSVSPSIYATLENIDEFVEKIDVPVDPEIIKRLQTIPEFVKAYEPDGLSQEEFMAYGATNRTLTQFIEVGWKGIENYQF